MSIPWPVLRQQSSATPPRDDAGVSRHYGSPALAVLPTPFTALLASVGTTAILLWQSCQLPSPSLAPLCMPTSVGTTAALLWQLCQLPSRLCWRLSALRQFCFGSPANSPHLRCGPADGYEKLPSAERHPPLGFCRRQSALRHLLWQLANSPLGAKVTRHLAVSFFCVALP